MQIFFRKQDVTMLTLGGGCFSLGLNGLFVWDHVPVRTIAVGCLLIGLALAAGDLIWSSRRRFFNGNVGRIQDAGSEIRSLGLALGILLVYSIVSLASYITSTSNWVSTAIGGRSCVGEVISKRRDMLPERMLVKADVNCGGTDRFIVEAETSRRSYEKTAVGDTVDVAVPRSSFPFATLVGAEPRLWGRPESVIGLGEMFLLLWILGREGMRRRILRREPEAVGDGQVPR